MRRFYAQANGQLILVEARRSVSCFFAATMSFATTFLPDGTSEPVGAPESRCRPARANHLKVLQMFTLSVHVSSDQAITLKEEMAQRHSIRARRPHEHRAVVTHTLRQRAGVPYEVEQHVCSDCRRVLDERTLRRAAA
jgi:hypothetical protein